MPCGYIENKTRVERHFYEKHVSDFEIPYVCKACDFKTGDSGKFTRHQESPAHSEKVTDPLLQAVCYQISTAPRFIRLGADMLKLSRAESRGHWLHVGGGCEVSPEEDDADSVVEDLRVQLLTTNETMTIRSPVVRFGADPTARVIQTVETGVNTEAVSPGDFDLIQGMNVQLMTMNGYMSKSLEQLYGYIEQVSKMNKRQEDLILKLEKKLNEMDERDRHERECERERERRRNRDYDRRK